MQYKVQYDKRSIEKGSKYVTKHICVVKEKHIDIRSLKDFLNSDDVNLVQVASETDVSRNTLYKMKRGEFSSIGMGTIEKVFDYASQFKTVKGVSYE